MKNFKLIKESWDRFTMNEQEQEKMSFMAIKAPIQGKIKELNEEIDSLIAPGAVFFDTETMGLQAVKTSYGSTNEAVKDPSSKVPAPISAYTTTRGQSGQMLTEIAAAFATAEQIVSGEFPSDTSHSRITIEPENKQEIAQVANFYKEGTVQFDEEKYLDLVRSKIAFAIKRNELFRKANEKEPEIFANVTDPEFNKAVFDKSMLRYYGVSEPTEEEIRAYYDEKIRPTVAGIYTPHKILLMTAYFGSEKEVMDKIEKGEATMEDLYNLNTNVLKQPEDTKSISEEAAIKAFYDFVKSKSASPIVAQNAGFDQGFISGRAKIYGLGDFDSLGLSQRVKDTLNLVRGFRNYLSEIVSLGENAKTEVRTMLSGMGLSPEEMVAGLTTAKGAATVSQGPLAAALKVEATRWHTAIADIEMLFNIFSKMIGIMKDIQKLDPEATLSSTAPKKPTKKSLKEFEVGDYASKMMPADTGTSEAQDLLTYLDNVIGLSKEALEMIDVFELAITKGGSSGSVLESKRVSKKPLKENRTITIRIGK